MKRDNLKLLSCFLLIQLIILVTANIVYKIQYNEYYIHKEFFSNILVEITSIIFEFIVLGIFLGIYQERKDKQNHIKRLKQEIEYIRLLRTDETKFKIFAIIKELNELQVTSIPLKQCVLTSLPELSKLNFSGSTLHATDFSRSIIKASTFNKSKGERVFFIDANIAGSRMQNCDFYRSNFKNSNCRSTSFKKSKIHNTIFDGANLSSAKFTDCDLKNCTFINAMLNHADFRGVDLEFLDFTGANVEGANFLHCRNFAHSNLKNAINFHLIKNR